LNQDIRTSGEDPGAITSLGQYSDCVLDARWCNVLKIVQLPVLAFGRFGQDSKKFTGIMRSSTADVKIPGSIRTNGNRVVEITVDYFARLLTGIRK
jgi:hypothetical protein